MRADQAYDELMRRVREESLLTGIEALLEWDEETYMPSGGVESRSEQLALVAGLLHERGTDPRFGELLGALEGSDLLADPAAPAAANVRVVRREYERFIRLLEAYVTLMDPWTANHDHQFTLGQFNVPFGYELERSSSLRELPERSRAETVLFPGERDLGLKLEQQWTSEVKTSLSVLNGGGINSVDFPNTDPTRNKDITARARLVQGTVDAAASYYWGHQVTPLTGPDVSTDKTRFGVDTQGYWQLPHAGGGSLKLELYTGHDVNPDSVNTLVSAPTGANPVRLLRPGADPSHLATDVFGWYAMVVQNVGDWLQAAVRYDTYDPNTTLAHDQYRRWSFGVNAFYDAYTRFTISYDAVSTQTLGAGGTTTDPHDNLWTFQLQHKW